MSTLKARGRLALTALRRRIPPRLAAALRYVAAAALVLVSGLSEWAIMPSPSPSPFLWFGVAMVLATIYGGWGPGLFVVVLSALAGNYFFLAPVGELTLSGPGFVATLSFLPVGVLVAWLGSRLREAKARAIEVSAALRQSEELFRTALDSMPEPVVIHDREDRVEYANPPMLALWGCSREAALGRRPEQLWAPPVFEMLRGPMLRARASGQRQTFSFRSPSGFLPRVQAKVDYLPIFDGGRHVGQLLGVGWDLTERMLAEEELRRSEAIIEQAGEIARVGAWSIDLADAERLGVGPLRWSSEVWRIFGYKPGEVELGLTLVLERTHPHDRKSAMTAFLRSLKKKSPYRHDFRILRPDSVERAVSVYGRWEFDAGGHPQRIVGAIQDITEQRRVEEALREADRRKDEFLGVLSHELRNPLAPIRNSAYSLASNPSLDERARRAVAIIERQSGHLSRLVDDLLDVTRIARGKTQLRRESLDLEQLVRRAVEDHRSQLESHRLEARLPEAEVRVDGDPTRLAQVVGNLLGNSAKFTPAGGRIALSLATRDGRAVLEVCDDGMGIDAETLGRLFEPFAQADMSLDRSKGGLGLGLALVKGLVEMHGGTVKASSQGLGRGASFTVELPLQKQAPVEPAVMPEAQPALGAGGRRVLIVEDNRDAADSLRETLEAWGHRVSVACSGAEGLALARELRPEVVLCDVGLPGEIDGYAVARSLRQDAATAGELLVAVSGYAQPEDVRRAREAGFDSHLAKPPDLTALERLLAG